MFKEKPKLQLFLEFQRETEKKWIVYFRHRLKSEVSCIVFHAILKRSVRWLDRILRGSVHGLYLCSSDGANEQLLRCSSATHNEVRIEMT